MSAEYILSEEILERETPKATLEDWDNNFALSRDREAAAITAAANAVKTVWENVVSEEAMLLLNLAKVGHEAKRTDTKTIYTLKALPATNIANWVLTGRYEINVSMESITGLTDALNDKLDADATAVDSDKLGGKTLSTIETERANAITAAINNILDGAPVAFDTLKEIADYINADTSGAAAMTDAINARVTIASIIDDLVTNVTNQPLSAAQGVALKNLIDGLVSSKQDNINAMGSWGGGDTPIHEYISASDYGEGGSKTVQDLAKIVTAIINDLKTQGLFTT